MKRDTINFLCSQAFNIDVYVDGVKQSIMKRYSEFEDLHKKVCIMRTIAYNVTIEKYFFLETSEPLPMFH